VGKGEQQQKEELNIYILIKTTKERFKQQRKLGWSRSETSIKKFGGGLNLTELRHALTFNQWATRGKKIASTGADK